MADVIERGIDYRKVNAIDAVLHRVSGAVREAKKHGDSLREQECRNLVDSWLDRRNQLYRRGCA